eukprot:403371098
MGPQSSTTLQINKFDLHPDIQMAIGDEEEIERFITDMSSHLEPPSTSITQKNTPKNTLNETSQSQLKYEVDAKRWVRDFKLLHRTLRDYNQTKNYERHHQIGYLRFEQQTGVILGN